MVRPFPRGKVKGTMVRVITIGQLARYVGVSTKTIRVYHDKGLLPEPERDASGYRRYDASHAIELIKIRTLAESGVPLARIRELRDAPEEEFQLALRQIDTDLTSRIRALRATQERLRELADGRLLAIPAEVRTHLQQLPRLGFSERWVALQADLWILVYATRPDTAPALFHEQAQILADPVQRELFLDYDHAHDLDPHDPRIDQLARQAVQATRARYGNGDLPGQDPASAIPSLIQSAVNASSPAWARIDALIREQLGLEPPR
ncbi:MerR family transcriptional regulator [Amycolatopsis lurida]